MEIKELLSLYGRHPQVRALSRALSDDALRVLCLSGLQGSAAALAFAAARPSVGGDSRPSPLLFVLDDAEEAGYFYHDLVQLQGESQVLFFPSSFRRAVKFGQRDAANEILRTEVLARLTSLAAGAPSPMVVSYPEALAERVVSKQTLDERTLQLRQGERVDPSFVEETLLAFGFHRTDYVYEPGQFAVRGSLVDVFSYSSEYPFRIDFFGDEVDSIRTFEVETQLSRSRQEQVTLVPELGCQHEDAVSLAMLLPSDLVLVARDFTFIAERVGQVWEEGFSKQAVIETGSVQMSQDPEKAESNVMNRQQLLIDAATFEHGFAPFRRVELSASAGRAASSQGKGKGSALITFSTAPQPIFHKNFDLLGKTFADYRSQGYTLYILADSQKQTDRLQAILEASDPSSADEEPRAVTPAGSGAPRSLFTPVSRTLHAGFADNTLKVCLFTDHQIFDRFHKYSLRSERARSGKVALTLKELQEFEIGDYVVHMDHGIGRFAGLVRVPNGPMVCCRR